MMKQQYPEKAPYKHWQLVAIGNETDSIEKQLQDWHKEHPSFAINQHQYRTNGETEVLSITYFDLDEAEKDLEEDLRTPRNNFYFYSSCIVAQSGEVKSIDDWYNDLDVDIISKSIDIGHGCINYGIIYVDRKEAAEAWDKKQENQHKIQQRLANKLAGVKEENNK